jgi:hypothetical protein
VSLLTVRSLPCTQVAVVGEPAGGFLRARLEDPDASWSEDHLQPAIANALRKFDAHGRARAALEPCSLTF